MQHEFYFSVIVTSFNRRELLEQVLLALEEQTLDKSLFEVIVVDDGSTDDTVDFLERYKNRAKLNFTYISKENEGQGIARNRGFEVSDGYIIQFLQDDIIPEPNFLEEHKKVHDIFTTENFICLGNTTWHPSLDVNNYMRFLEDIGMQFKYGSLDKAKIIDPKLGVRLASYKFFYTSNISLKRTLFEKQKFNEKFKQYGWEDIELGYRLEHEEGAVILYNPKAKAYHIHQMSENDLPEKMKQIGKSAILANKINKKMKAVPSFFKRICFRTVTNPLILHVLKQLSQGSSEKHLTNMKKLYYYACMKKWFLKGLKAGKRS